MECKTEKRNSQLREHRQPMEQTRGLLCTCDSGVTRCQSQHQCHFWRINSIFEAYCRESELGSCQSNLCHSRDYERLQKSKDSLKACFKNVNIEVYIEDLARVLMFY